MVALATPNSDLRMPDDLTHLGRKAYRVILDFLTERGLLKTNGCETFYSPIEWRRQGESYGSTSHLVIVYDGSPLKRVFSMDACYEYGCATGKLGPEVYALYEAMQERLREAGFFFEECTRWFGAVYSI